MIGVMERVHGRGERRRVEVLTVETGGGWSALGLRNRDDPAEGYLILEPLAPGEAIAAVPGDLGVIVFGPGGPMGGRWTFERTGGGDLGGGG